MAERKFFTIEEVAQYLKVSEHKVRMAIREGTLSAVKVMEEYCVTPQSLFQFVQRIDNLRKLERSR